MDQVKGNPPTATDLFPWFCIKTQPKRERLACSQLASLEGVSVIFPQARYWRKTPKGKRLSLDPIFPNYLFAAFNPSESLREVGFCRGVSYVVKKGPDFARVPETVIDELRALTPDDGIIELPQRPFQVGDHIRVIAGVFAGTEACIVGLAPPRQRVQILLQILGRDTVIEIPNDLVDHPDSSPQSMIRASFR